ncbi:hypothetical protein M9Y10_042859 [Tritrichomonas musculus]|uniref:Uncharacterized protein n=1 Tax=Tritrichomonas musculus TaxID=1915356 RepID=A0ABR2K0X0_9EUKA
MLPKVNENVTFIENYTKWDRLGKMKIINKDGFCYTHSPFDDSFRIDDFAFLTTLPRFYTITKSGKCIVDPSKRGMFNTTMKYIFGEDYEKDGIYILCKKLDTQKVLVISSEKLINKTLDYFSDDENVTVLNKQFNISGFDRYQINFDSNLVIQPLLVTSDRKLIGSTHFIVGGGIEKFNDIKLFAEIVFNEFQPKFISSFLIGYYPIRKVFKDYLLLLELINKAIFYKQDHLSREIDAILQMYSQFNISQEHLYTIGHSITGTYFKIASYYSNTTGVAFESAETDSNLIFEGKYYNHKQYNSYIQFTNVFSSKFYSVGNDKSCTDNGVLPSKFTFPNVYETACQVAISCSETFKYVPLCMQVLDHDEENSEIKFKDSFNAFLEHYHFN